LRPATAADGPSVRAVVFSVLDEYGLRPDSAGTDADLENVASSYFARGGCFLVAVSSTGAIVGCGGLYPLDSRDAEIRKMYLVPGVRGRGLGRTLLKALIGAARERGFERVIVETASVLKEAISLYRGSGFVPFARENLPRRCDQAYVLDVAFTVHPATPERWPDIEAIFKAKGCSVARGCWCMYYRKSGSRGPLPPGITNAQANRAELKALVDAGPPPGLIGYRGSVPIGWVSIGPRVQYAKLERSPVMKPVDDRPVWSVICFVVPAEHRGQGIAQALLDGAIAYAKEQGATLIEAYPVDKSARSKDDQMWFGAKSMYDGTGFKEVARRKPWRPIVRKPV
jgi:GNAT superfamily N-acetyltransferase